MSSTANPYGMIPVLNYGASYNTQGFDSPYIADAYATSIFFGDVVKFASDGTIQKDTGTTTLTPAGVFLGCRYIDPTFKYALDAGFWPASTTTTYTSGPLAPRGKVVTWMWGVWQIQANGPVAITDLYANAAIVQTAGTSAVGKSRNALNASSINTTNTLPLRIVGFVEKPDNAPGDAFTDVLVTFNNTQQILVATGV